MTHQQWVDFFAKILIGCMAFVVVVDAGAELDIRWARNLKWSLWWVIARYVGVGCALLLAVDVLT